MPVNSISYSPITLTPTGGTTGVITGSASSYIAVNVYPDPIQLLGFVPLVLCSFDECRTFNGDCYFNPVVNCL